MPKFSKKRALQALGEDSDPDQEDVKPAKKTKATASKSELGSGKDDDGNPYWEVIGPFERWQWSDISMLITSRAM